MREARGYGPQHKERVPETEGGVLKRGQGLEIEPRGFELDGGLRFEVWAFESKRGALIRGRGV